MSHSNAGGERSNALVNACIRVAHAESAKCVFERRVRTRVRMLGSHSHVERTQNVRSNAIEHVRALSAKIYYFRVNNCHF